LERADDGGFIKSARMKKQMMGRGVLMAGKKVLSVDWQGLFFRGFFSLVCMMYLHQSIIHMVPTAMYACSRILGIVPTWGV
jgi:hypothetical protein